MTQSKTYLRRFKLAALLSASITGPAAAAQINTYGKLVISADDYSFSARLTARVQMDGNFYHSGSPDRTLTSGLFMRRARLGLEGNFREWEYSVGLDFATDVTSLEDAYVARKIGPGKLKIGQFKVYESLEQIADSNDLPLMERSYVSEMAPGFKMGSAYYGTVGHFGYSENIYNNLEAVDAGGAPVDDGVGVVERAYVAPVNTKTETLHFAASYAYVYTDTVGDKASVRPIGRADTYRDGEDFKFTLYDRKNERAQIDRFILESAAINGPLYVQGEYMAGEARTKIQSQDSFNTWYAQASYALTGESRKYHFQDGTFERLVPNRESGAWEINARYQEATRVKVTDAKLTSTELGVNYYANMNVRFMLNYGWTDNQLINDKPRLLFMRMQFDF